MRRSAGRPHRRRTTPQAFPAPARAFEGEATTFSDFQPLYVPGLLQTEKYAQAVLKASPTQASAKDVDRQVALRMERQGVLTKNDPPELWFVVSETALHVQVGTPEVTIDQLHHLAELAARPNIRRDSKDPHGPSLIFTSTAWRTFARGVRNKAYEQR
jgi:hypothetical protein